MKIKQSILSITTLFSSLVMISPLFVNAEEASPAATPYRPTVSNPAALSEPGWLELELGGQITQGGSDQRRSSLPFLAKLAFTENWGILVGSELAVRRTDTDGINYDGVGDTTIIVKHRIPTHTDGSAWGIEAGYKLATAKDTIGSGKNDFMLNGIYSADFSDNHLDLNLGATRLGAVDAGDGRLQYSWAASVSHNINEKWGIFGEFSGLSQRHVAAQSQFMFGTNYNFSNRIVFDAGATLGLAGTSQDWSLFSGVTVLLGQIW